MIIKRVVIKNVGPHEHFEQEFGTGLIGIFGSNGSGKTTMLNSIYAGLTNDFTRLNDTRAGAIRDTSDSKDTSSVLLECSHMGSQFELLRSLRPNKSCLKVDGKIYTKVVEIRDKHQGA